MINKPNLNLERDKEYSFEELASMECQNDYCYKEMLEQFNELLIEVDRPDKQEPIISIGDTKYRVLFMLENKWQALQSQLEEA